MFHPKQLIDRHNRTVGLTSCACTTLSTFFATTMGSSPSKPTIQASESISDEKCPVKDACCSLSSLLITSPNSVDGSLSLDAVSAWETSASSNPKLQLARTILSHSDIQAALTSRSARITDTHIFNNVVDFKTGPVTNQKSSGRCWIFATTNVLRYSIMKSLKLKEFQLSQVSNTVFIILCH
jgi:bleomycin hydrolase